MYSECARAENTAIGGKRSGMIVAGHSGYDFSIDPLGRTREKFTVLV